MKDLIVRIAVCDRRTDRRYRNVSQPWSYLRERNRRPIRTSETMAEFPGLSKEKRDEVKDQGGFVGGHLKDGIRKNGNVIGWQVLALDADSIPEGTDFVGQVKKAWRDVPGSCIRHTSIHPRNSGTGS